MYGSVGDCKVSLLSLATLGTDLEVTALAKPPVRLLSCCPMWTSESHLAPPPTRFIEGLGPLYCP